MEQFDDVASGIADGKEAANGERLRLCKDEVGTRRGEARMLGVNISLGSHSARRATIGSTLAAWRAGSQAASVTRTAKTSAVAV